MLHSVSKEKGYIDVTVHKCGLFINVAIPWLAATPDSVVEIGEEKGCLEVKCPFVCAKSPQLQLQWRNHFACTIAMENCFYQVQTQLFVT